MSKRNGSENPLQNNNKKSQGPFVSMVVKYQDAKHVEEVTYVSMVYEKNNANLVEAVPFVSMVDEKLNANHVEAVPFVSLKLSFYLRKNLSSSIYSQRAIIDYL